MGKQAKIKQARKNGELQKKEPVYNMTQAQLDAYVKREIVKFKRDISEEITSKIISTLLMQCFDILHSVFKFGNLRLKKFRYNIDLTSECISEWVDEDANFDYLSEVTQTLEDAGIEVDKLLSGNIDRHELRRKCDMEKLMPKVADFPEDL